MELDVRGELQIGGAWVDATGNLLKRQLLKHTRGRQDQGARVDPSTCRPLINNTDGRFSPDNPLSPYYGQFGRNTPFRLSIRAGTPALELNGNGANNASTPDHATLDLTGDLDLRWEGEADWYATGAQMLIGKWGAAGNRSYAMRVQNGSLYIHTTQDGTVGRQHGMPLPVGIPRHAALRVTFDVDNGAGGVTSRHYWAPTLDGPWTQFGGDLISGGTITVFSSSAPLTIAPEQLDATPPRQAVTGRCYRAEVRNGIDGPLVAAPGFSAQPVGTTPFVDSVGRTWTMSGSASITNRHTRLSHELAAYPTRWHPSGKHVWVEAQTAGILRRLRRGSKALDSTLRRRIPSGSPLAYWPLEEGRDATQFYSPIPGVRPLRAKGLDFAAADSLAGSSPLPTLKGGAELSGSVPAPSGSPTQWHTEFVFRAESGPATIRTVLQWTSTGTVRRWRLMIDTGGAQIRGYDADDTQIITQSVILTGLGVFGAWTRWKLFARQNGANVDYTIAWVPIGGTGGVVGGSYAGTVGRITGLMGPEGAYSADLDGLAIGHIGVFSTADTLIYNDADIAFTGETAGERMQRLATEEQVPLSVSGVVAEQEQVGPQLPDAVLDLLAEAADADGGILYEDREQLALRYRDRASMYNQTPALVLDYNAPGLAPPLEPTGDDDATENDVTVSRVNGSSGNAVLEEGALSIQAPPDGVGPYPVSVSLNLHSDEQTEPIAFWRMHLGTYEGRRYPQVHVMVHQAPELADQVLAVDVGDKIVIKNPPFWVAPGDIELIVQGYEETFDEFAWDIVFTCTPGQPWNVGVLEDPVFSRADSAGSELAAAVDADDTTLTVLTTGGLPWITANPQMNANSDFETNLTGWGGSGGTIARVPTPQPAPFTGDWSLQFTPNGVAEFPNAGSTTMPVVVGRQYVASGWLRSATARSVALNINWFAAAGAYLSTSANDVTVEAGEWTWFELTATAPATALTANLAATVPDFPPATDVLWGDQITLRPVGVDASSPSDFPFDIRAGGEVMTVNAITSAVADAFGRTLTDSWGTADSGQVWTNSSGAAADYDVTGTAGTHTVTTVDVSRRSAITAPSADVDLQAAIATGALATGGPQLPSLMARVVDGNTMYLAQLSISTTQTITLSVRKRLSGVETELDSFTTALTHVAGTFYQVRFQVTGSLVQAKAWLASNPEPGGWQVSATDTSLTAAGSIGCRSLRQTANTNANLVVSFDNFKLLNPQRFTVVRSRNGVVKSHTVGGTDVRLAYPTIVAL